MEHTIRTATLHSNTVMHQDEFNRFIRKVERAGEETLQDLAKKMKTRAKLMAPKRTGRLRNSIDYYKVGDGRYVLATSVPYAYYQEHGTGIHGKGRGKYPMPPHVTFFWKKADREWVPADNGHPIHPGVPAKQFMRRAFKAVMTMEARESLRRNFRG